MMRLFTSISARRVSFVLALSAGFAAGAAEVVPAERRVDWKPGVTVGVPGGIPADRTHVVDVTRPPFNADRTGAADAQPAIAAAIAAAKKGDVVFLPAGRYRVERPIDVRPNRSGITIRGEGEASVIDDRVQGATGVFNVGSSSSYTWNYQPIDVTGGMGRGSTTLTVKDASALRAGQLIQITQLNDLSVPVVAVGGFERMRRQKTAVVSKTATTVEIFPPLYWTLKAELSPQIVAASNQASGVGIEELRIDGKESKSRLIDFEQCVGCWIRNVHSTLAANYHYYVVDSLFCEVRHCFIDELNHVGSNGAGLLMGASSACLIEDNVVYKCFPHLEINAGCCGNVFAYNFCEGNNTFGIMGVSIDCNHGAHNSYDLYEGNVASVFQNDGYFGSASEITVFRNWFHGTCDTTEPKTDKFGRCVSLCRFARNFSVVGNVLGRTGDAYVYENGENGTGYDQRYIYNLGLPNMGNGGFKGLAPPWKDPLNSKKVNANGYQELDRDVARTTIRKGNWNAKDGGVPAVEAIEGAELPKSLFRTEKPAWFGKLTWPPFDAAAPNQSYEAIPAGYRFKYKTEP